MIPFQVITHQPPQELLNNILSTISKDGPINQELLETLSYLKEYFPDLFSSKEPDLMYVLGLFYKVKEPENLISLIYSIYKESIEYEYGQTLTPIQASIRHKIDTNKYFSFSAPTSAGKSHLLRELVLGYETDIVIVLPSRALISEYLVTVRKIVQGRKDILVLQFVDDVNRAKAARRIFIVTPERCAELFRLRENFNVGLFIFDEAQISEESVRGVNFDALVRRSDKVFKDAKKVFVHPFVENPEAQLVKHGFEGSSAESHVYRQNAVGKIYIERNKRTGTYSYFSPFHHEGYRKKNKHDISFDPVKEILIRGGSVLIFVSKKLIYSGVTDGNFKKYLEILPPVTDPIALKIIDDIERIIGASERNSELVSLLRIGVVIHHGSVPLVVRTLLEDYANKGFARVCFATSTLAQGVNIPFDLVWIDNFRFLGSEENKALGLKNLIGRAGRTTQEKNSFDYGYVVVSGSKSFMQLFNKKAKIDEVSHLDIIWDGSEDHREFIEAIKNQDINDDYGLPEAKVKRLTTDEVFETIERLLDSLFIDGKIISGDKYQSLSKDEKMRVKQAFQSVYEASLGRELTKAEKGVMSTALAIFLWHIQGKSFSSLLDLRYSYLTQRAEQRALYKAFTNGEIDFKTYLSKYQSLPVRYSAIPFPLPDSFQTALNRFKGILADKLRYDLLVYDTYDYLDKVVSFSLADIFSAAFEEYHSWSGDPRAKIFSEYMRYGTNDPIAILLIRYGFPPEEVVSLSSMVEYIDEERVIFTDEAFEIESPFSKYLIDHYS